MARFGGLLGGMFSRRKSGATGDDLSPRFRLLARSLYTFIQLREDEAKTTSKKQVFSWSTNCLFLSKTQKKLLKHFADQCKSFTTLKSYVQQLTAALTSSSLTLLEIDMFLTQLVSSLFPVHPWPGHWCQAVK